VRSGKIPENRQRKILGDERSRFFAISSAER
jgi:hypothetical protein